MANNELDSIRKAISEKATKIKEAKEKAVVKKNKLQKVA